MRCGEVVVQRSDRDEPIIERFDISALARVREAHAITVGPVVLLTRRRCAALVVVDASSGIHAHDFDLGHLRVGRQRARHVDVDHGVWVNRVLQHLVDRVTRNLCGASPVRDSAAHVQTHRNRRNSKKGALDSRANRSRVNDIDADVGA